MSFLLLIAVGLKAQWLFAGVAGNPGTETGRPIRIACVGDSITYGHGLKNRERECYPAKLAAKLGDGFEVRGFGVSGATLLARGTRPYVDQAAYREALAFKPQVVVIMLGTNDTNQKTWPDHKSEFVSDYLKLIKAFRDVDKSVRIWICLPVPLFRDRGKPWDTDAILNGEVVPKIKEVSREANVQLIDLNSEFAKSEQLLPDGVHPNAEGAELMATAVHKRLADELATKSAGKP
jgi:sialate O-acetylesterase